MDLDTFRHSLDRPNPPPDLSLALRTLWWDAKGEWHRAHACAQEDEGRTGAVVHAYLHRKEGDPSNAAYWYRRADRQPPTGPLAAEWEELVRELTKEGGA